MGDTVNWSNMQKIRKQNAKKRKTNLQSIMFGHWNHDRFDKLNANKTTTAKGSMPKKTLFDALESLKQKETLSESGTESDIDLLQSVKRKKSKRKKKIAINIKADKKTKKKKS